MYKLIRQRLLSDRFRGQAGFTMPAVVLTIFATGALSAAAVALTTADIGLQQNDRYEKQAIAAAYAGVQRYASALYLDTNFWQTCDNNPGTTPVNDVGPDVPANRRWQLIAPEKGASLPAPEVAEPSPSDPTGPTQIAGAYRAWPHYTIDLVPVNGAPSCGDFSNSTATMIDPLTDTFSVRSTGRAGDRNRTLGQLARRTVVATFKRKNFSDFAYFTHLETPHPIFYYYYKTTGVSAGESTAVDNYNYALLNCDVFFRDGRNFDTNKCAEFPFTGADKIQGPFHTNDAIRRLANPELGRNAADLIEISSELCYARSPGKEDLASCHNNPGGSVKGTLKTGPEKAPVYTLPGATQLREQFIAAATGPTGTNGLILTGAHEVEFLNQNPPALRYRKAYQNGAVGNWDATVTCCGTGTDIPSGVIYVQDAPGCTDKTYNAAEPEPAFDLDTAGGSSDLSTSANVNYIYKAPFAPVQACGNALVAGQYRSRATVAAENDILVTRKLTWESATDDMLGLVAAGFIRLRRNDYGGSGGADSCITQGMTDRGQSKPAVLRVPELDAAMVAATGSFAADKFWCDKNDASNIIFTGAFTQKWRGPLGTAVCNNVGACGDQTGYDIKTYIFDDRLVNQSPPFFVHPTRSAWRVQRAHQQSPGCPAQGSGTADPLAGLPC